MDCLPENKNRKKIKILNNARWYCTVDTLNAVFELKDVILQEVLPNVTEEKSRLINEFDWGDSTKTLEVLKPINGCIGKLKRKDIILGAAFYEVLKYAKRLFDSQEPEDVLNEARKSFLWHFNIDKFARDEFGLYITSYCLDRNFGMTYINEEGMDLALEAIIKVAIKSRFSAFKEPYIRGFRTLQEQHRRA